MFILVYSSVLYFEWNIPLNFVKWITDYRTTDYRTTDYRTTDYRLQNYRLENAEISAFLIFAIPFLKKLKTFLSSLYLCNLMLLTFNI